MSSPGKTQLATDLETTFVFAPHGTFTFASSTDFMQKLAEGMDNGWTCSSPTTPSTFVTEFAISFSGFMGGGSLGETWMTCIATALDAEVSDWVASWTGVVHTYVVSAANIIIRIDTCAPFVSSASDALRDSVANTFETYFGQETG